MGNVKNDFFSENLPKLVHIELLTISYNTPDFRHMLCQVIDQRYIFVLMYHFIRLSVNLIRYHSIKKEHFTTKVFRREQLAHRTTLWLVVNRVGLLVWRK